MFPLRTQPIEYGQSRFFRARSQVPGGADTRRAPLLALAGSNEFARFVHKQLVGAEKWLRESNAARISVEEIQIRLKEFFSIWASNFFYARRGKIVGPHRIWWTFANRGAQVAAIAHQQQCRHRFQGMQQAEHAALPLAHRKRQSGMFGLLHALESVATLL